MKPRIKVAFASGTDELNRRLIERMRALLPELPLWVVSDFPPEDADLKWIPYRVNRSLAENLARCRAQTAGHRVPKMFLRILDFFRGFLWKPQS